MDVEQEETVHRGPAWTRAERFLLGTSGTLEGILAGLHLGAGACLGCADVPVGLTAGGLCLLAAHLVASVRAHARRSAANAVVELIRGDHSRWRVVTRAGRVVEGEVLAGSLVHPFLVLLGIRDSSGARIRVIVPPNALAPEQFRRLRVALREVGGPTR